MRIKTRPVKMPPHCGNCRWGVWDDWLGCQNPFRRFDENIEYWHGHYEQADLEGIEVLLSPTWWDAEDDGVIYSHVCDYWQILTDERTREYTPLLTSLEAQTFHDMAVKWIKANCD